MIPEPMRQMPNPPRLHWGFILAAQVLTLGMFQIIWIVVQANWVRRANGSNKALIWSIVNLCMIPALFLLAVIEGLLGVPAGGPVMSAIGSVFRMGILVTGFGAVFVTRNELENSPISIPLSGVLTFFLGVIYLQYHLCDYSVEDKQIPEGSLGLAG
jgi:hypothetical protein